jgi:hypothetical protein
MKIEKTSTPKVPGHKSTWNRLFEVTGGTAPVREVVVITKGPVEFGGTVNAPHDAPFGNPEQVRTYETSPMSVTM